MTLESLLTYPSLLSMVHHGLSNEMGSVRFQGALGLMDAAILVGAPIAARSSGNEAIARKLFQTSGYQKWCLMAEMNLLPAKHNFVGMWACRSSLKDAS